jgi:hypothetical protein
MAREGRVQRGQEQGKTDLTLGEEAPTTGLPASCPPYSCLLLKFDYNKSGAT